MVRGGCPMVMGGMQGGRSESRRLPECSPSGGARLKGSTSLSGTAGGAGRKGGSCREGGGGGAAPLCPQNDL